jgi:transcription initiation factor TFIIIB Brf1 subunit/transcription initiation factor TFIIB
MFPNTAEESKERVKTGMPTSLTLSDMGLSTVIGKTNRDVRGCKIQPSVLSTTHFNYKYDNTLLNNYLVSGE